MRIQKFILFQNTGETEQPFSIPLLAGMTARVFSVSIVNPLELIRTKMQSQKISYYGTYLRSQGSLALTMNSPLTKME